MTAKPQNILIPSRFQVVISRLPNTVFYLTSCEIPGVSVSELTQGTPFVNLPVPGDKLYFDPLRIVFVQDTALAGWNDIFKWLVGLGRPVDGGQYAGLAANSEVGGVTTFGTRPPYADLTVNIYTSKNNIQATFNFVNAFPLSLDPIQLTYEESADQVLKCGASFRYDYYTYSYTPVV